MHGLVHKNRAFYNDASPGGHHFRQVAVIQWKTWFELRTYEGNWLLSERKLLMKSPKGEAIIHGSLESAIEAFEKECQRCYEEGWQLVMTLPE